MSSKKSFGPITIILDYNRFPVNPASINAVAVAIWSAENLTVNDAVTVVLCSDYKMQQLNNKFRRLNRYTDVLSFKFDNLGCYGEIYISTQRADIQGRRYKIGFDAEIERLFVHGMLHLLGYTHEKRKNRKIMEIAENRFCLLSSPV